MNILAFNIGETLMKLVQDSGFAGFFADGGWRNLIMIAIASATLSISSVFNPLEVTAGVPRRTPLVTNGDCGSFGIVFLFAVMFTESNSFSTSFPVSPKLVRSTNIR